MVLRLGWKKKKRLKYLWVKWHLGICFKIFQFKEKVGVDEAKWPNVDNC